MCTYAVCCYLGFLGGSRVVYGLRVLHATRSLRSIGALSGLQIVIQTVFYSMSGQQFNEVKCNMETCFLELEQS